MAGWPKDLTRHKPRTLIPLPSIKDVSYHTESRRFSLGMNPLMENPHGSRLSRAASLPMILANQGGDPIRPLRSKVAISWSISYLLSSSKYSQDSGFIFLAIGDTWLINSVRSLIYSPHHLIIQHTFTKFLERDTSFRISLEEDQALLLKDTESRWGIRYRTK